MSSNSIAVWQLIATVALGFLTIGGYFRLSYLSNRTYRFLRLDEEINNIVNTWIKYPLLEDENHIKSYREKTLSAEDIQRFNAYSTLHFNAIESLYRYFRGNTKKMKDYCEYEDMILSHKEWWKENQNNPRKSYKSKFVNFVEEVISTDN